MEGEDRGLSCRFSLGFWVLGLDLGVFLHDATFVLIVEKFTKLTFINFVSLIILVCYE